jgi:hypothetical protein
VCSVGIHSACLIAWGRNDQKLQIEGAGKVLDQERSERYSSRSRRQSATYSVRPEYRGNTVSHEPSKLFVSALKGAMHGRYAVKVNKNWRITFAWHDFGPAATDIDYEDYH